MAMRANAPSHDAPSGMRKVLRYPWLGGGLSRAQRVAALLALFMGVSLAYGYVIYLRGDDVSPDSEYGYIFAIAGTLLLLLVGVGYTLRKRLRRNWSGLLHGALAWHTVGGILALALILMHAVGNFHPRTGSYALYGLIALVASGLIGRLFDRIAPRLAAKTALRALTPEGEERLETLVSDLDRKRRFRLERKRKVRQPEKASAPWDIAYYDLDAHPNEIPSLLNQQGAAALQETVTQRAVRSGASVTFGDIDAGAAKGAMAPESTALRQALGAERLFLHLIRVWRYLHTAISVITLGLILWHLEYAATLLMAAR